MMNLAESGFGTGRAHASRSNRKLYNFAFLSPCKHAMKKPSSRAAKHPSASPQTAQLEAVRQLSRTGRSQEARARLAELRAHYPAFKPLLALAWEIEDDAGDALSATLHAWDWSRASPHSLAALTALQNSALANGFAALAGSAAQSRARMEDKPEPVFPALHSPLGELSFDQAVAADLSRLFLSFNRYSDAIAVLEDLDHPSLRNNLALTRFALGEIAPALADFEANWRQETRNLFALHQVVRLRLWTGGLPLAKELEPAMRDAQPLRAEDACGKMLALMLLGPDKGVLQAWHALQDAKFWAEEKAREHSLSLYAAGAAALRTGDPGAAARFFAEAYAIDADYADADQACNALMRKANGGAVDIKVGEFRDWFPQSWADELQSVKRKSTQAQEAMFDAHMRRCDAHADYLATATELGGTAVRFYAMSVLKQRALNKDDAARDTLCTLLTRPCGPDSVRIDLDAWLQKNSLIEAGQFGQLLIKGEVREIALRSTRLHAEYTDIGLPPKAQDRLAQMHERLALGDLHGALAIAEELAAAYPRHATLAGNIASIKEGLGSDMDELEALFKHAAALDPNYLFAQAGLIRIAARKGDTARARDMLRPLQSHEAYHFTEWRTLLLAERAIALAENDMQAVLDVDRALKELQEQFS